MSRTLSFQARRLLAFERAALAIPWVCGVSGPFMRTPFLAFDAVCEDLEPDQRGCYEESYAGRVHPQAVTRPPLPCESRIREEFRARHLSLTECHVDLLEQVTYQVSK